MKSLYERLMDIENVLVIDCDTIQNWSCSESSYGLKVAVSQTVPKNKAIDKQIKLIGGDGRDGKLFITNGNGIFKWEEKK